MRQPKPKDEVSAIRAHLMAVARGQEPLYPRPGPILVIRNIRTDRIQRALSVQTDGLRDVPGHTVLAP